MKLERDDPTFTAWLLGEATAEEAMAWQMAMDKDSEMQREWREQKAFMAQIESTLAESARVLDLRQRDQVMSLARSKDVSNQPLKVAQTAGRPWLPWSFATAALATIGIWWGMQNPATQRTGSLSYQQVTREISLLPSDDGGFPGKVANTASEATAAGGGGLLAQRDEMWQRQPAEFLRLVAQRVAAEPLPLATELAPASERGWSDASMQPIAPLPMRIGISSWQWARKSTLENAARPAPELIRVEEWVQAFPMRTGITRAQQGIQLSAAVLAPGPFATSQSAIVLSLTNASDQAKELSWQYHAPQNVKYRLVGFRASLSHAVGAKRLMAAGESLQVMIEVDGPAQIVKLGELRCQGAHGEFSLPIALSSAAKEEAEFYRLLVMMAAKLQGQPVDAGVLSRCIERVENGVLDAQRAEAVALMKRWL